MFLVLNVHTLKQKVKPWAGFLLPIILMGVLPPSLDKVLRPVEMGVDSKNILWDGLKFGSGLYFARFILHYAVRLEKLRKGRL